MFNGNYAYSQNQVKSSLDMRNSSYSQSQDLEANEVYQSMQGYLKPRILKYSLQIDQVSWGESHMAFITDWGHLYTMGNNDHGKLGLRDLDLAQATVPSLVDHLGDNDIIQVSCGKNHTACVSRNGDAFVWGSIKNGALGFDSKYDISAPQLVDYLVNYKIKVAKVSCGWHHTCFLTRSGDVFITGINNDNPDSLITFIQLPEKCTDIACGENHALVLTKSGFVHSIDLNFNEGFHSAKIKELETEFVTQIACNRHWAVVTDEGHLYVWGSSILGDFTSPERIACIPKSVVNVSLGYWLFGWIDSSGLIWAWGKNSHGELGVGDWELKKTPYPVMALKSKKVTSLSCGGSFYIAIGKSIVIKKLLNRNIQSEFISIKFRLYIFKSKT